MCEREGGLFVYMREVVGGRLCVHMHVCSLNPLPPGLSYLCPRPSVHSLLPGGVPPSQRRDPPYHTL